MMLRAAARATPQDLASTTPEWEEPDCLLCGSRRRSFVVAASDNAAAVPGPVFRVVRCQDCGLCYTSPRPTPAVIGRYYPDVYPPHDTPDPRPPRRWRQKERRGLAVEGGGRLLDFGCGGGSFLERMRRQGWRVVGLDTSAAAVKSVRHGLGLRALLGTLPHPRLRPESFDLITMWQSLEHVHDPLTVLREARRLLVPGGRLLVATPNLDGLPFRWFGPAWNGLDLPRHLTHFTTATLRQMLEAAGFRLQSLRMLRHSRWLRTSAQLACRDCPEPPWPWVWLRSKPVSRLAAWYAALVGQADCMLVSARR